jgi:phage terminase large subunit-like protein
VLLPEGAPWLEAYVAEITGFPGTKHDDQVDSTAQALASMNSYAEAVAATEHLARWDQRRTYEYS